MTTSADPFLLREGLGDLDGFYARLFAPAEKAYGKRHALTLSSVVGFQAGGPVGLFTFAGKQPKGFVTYGTCELACYQGQQESAQGPFELLLTCNDERWARAVLTGAGALSFDAVLDDGHSLDLGRGRPSPKALQGLVLHRFSYLRQDSQPFCVLRAVGVTASELKFAQTHGVEALLPLLERGGALARTDVSRGAVALPSRRSSTPRPTGAAPKRKATAKGGAKSAGGGRRAAPAKATAPKRGAATR